MKQIYNVLTEKTNTLKVNKKFEVLLTYIY